MFMIYTFGRYLTDVNELYYMNERSNKTGQPFSHLIAKTEHVHKHPAGHGKWDDVYKGTKPEDLPWYFPLPDPDLLSTLKEYAKKPGQALDLGCGPGTHSIALAKQGWKVTALDISSGAIRMAERFARESGVEIDFKATDILAYIPQPASFDLVHDWGCLHALDPNKRPGWANLVATALRPGGLLIAKEFAPDPDAHFGPPGFTEKELRDILDERFVIEVLKKSEYRVRGHKHAGFLLIARRV